VGIFLSLDVGTTWTRVGQGLPNVPVVDLQLNTNFETLAAATQGRGVFTISTDLLGPHVTAITTTPGTAAVTLTFSEPINANTLTNAAVTLTDPSGTAVTPTGITEVDPPGDLTTFEITFSSSSTQGSWTLKLNTKVTDLANNSLNQNQNSVNGEVPADEYTGRFLFTTATTNTAPTLNTVSPTFPSILEDPASNTGTDLATFVGGLSITDPDAGAVKGIAVTSADNSNGVWQFSLDSGVSWASMGTVGLNKALLLTVGNKVRFVPNPGFKGTATLLYRAWDGDKGTAGSYLDPLSPGNLASFSVNSATAYLPVNNAPDLAS